MNVVSWPKSANLPSTGDPVRWFGCKIYVITIYFCSLQLYKVLVLSVLRLLSDTQNINSHYCFIWMDTIFILIIELVFILYWQIVKMYKISR